MNYTSAESIEVHTLAGYELFMSNNVLVSYAVGQSTLNVCHQDPGAAQGTVTIFPLSSVRRAIVKGSR